jgi:peptidoglycan/LPS O-acetylase OafA/YrhL
MSTVDLDRLQHRDAAAETVHVPALRSFRPDIQGMRAVAVLLVVLYHAGVPFLPGGFVGVDVFFVISGYLITAHLLGELWATGRVSFASFYARRVKRLLPMATLVILVTLAATWIVTSGLQARELAVDSLWAGLFAMNIRLASEGVDYQAADGGASALQHFWSLAIEEQFYLFWPILLFVASLSWLRSRRRSPGGSADGSNADTETPPVKRISVTALTIVITVIVVASFVDGIHQTRTAQSLAYFATPARAWELVVGGLVALHAPWLARRSWLQQNWLIVIGLGSILLSAVIVTDSSAFPGWWALLPALGSAAIIVAGLAAPTRTEQFLLDRPVVQGLGNISYSLYLWHWPMLVLAPAYLSVDELTLLQALLVVGAAVWVSTITFLGIENRLRLLRSFAPRRGLALGAALTAGVVGISLAASVWIPDPKATGTYVNAVASSTNLRGAIVAATVADAVPANAQPALSQAGKDKPRATTGDGYSCMVGLLDASVSRDPRGSCVFGDPDGGRTVLLTGDSHAYQWFPALEALALRNHWKLISMTKSGCTLYNVKLFNTMLARDYRECYGWRTEVFDRITRESPDLIITSAFTASVNRDPSYTRRWVRGEEQTVRRLVGTGAKVVVLADTPYPATNIPRCLALHVSDTSKCAVPRQIALSDPERRRSGAEAALRAGAVLIDPVKWFCTAGSCPAIVGNTIVYSDNSHMTATYSRLLASRLERELP